MERVRCEVTSPIDPLTLIAEGDVLVGVRFADGGGRRWFSGDRELAVDDAHPVLVRARRQLREYFAGERQAFDLPLQPQGDEFRMRVWSQLCTIPYGSTVSYGDVAAALGDRRLAQAVGQAVGANPLPVVIPCHRVVGSDGSLTGFGGGLARKRFLLELEEPAELAAARLF
ncbi:MAG TPA: methylated-DNA--[protein]-cysteine S-methyltransferase [Microlunatus sp.]|nr:methylated-DNA--[protein]-cysteine S-methyltransferase [Microlunatus sp.]